MKLCRITLALLLMPAWALAAEHGEYELDLIRHYQAPPYVSEGNMLRWNTQVVAPYTLLSAPHRTLRISGGHSYFPTNHEELDLSLPVHPQQNKFSPKTRDISYLKLADEKRDGRMVRQVSYRYERNEPYRIQLTQNDDAPSHYLHSLSYSVGYRFIENRSTQFDIQGRLGGIVVSENRLSQNLQLDSPYRIFDDTHYSLVYGLSGTLQLLVLGPFEFKGIASYNYYDPFSESSLGNLALDSPPAGSDTSFSLNLQYQF